MKNEHKYFVRIFLIALIAISTSVSFFACSNDAPKLAKEDKTNSLDTSKSTPAKPRKVEFIQKLTKDGVEQMIFNEYAKQAVNIPKRVLDSFMLLKNPKLINAEIIKYGNMLDSNTRAYICEKYRITKKELSQILKKKERETKSRKGWDSTQRN